MPTDYPQREPLSGWYDDTAEVVHRQVVDARSAGIDFFLFDWYDLDRAENTTDKTLNSALALFKADRKKRGMKYALNSVTAPMHCCELSDLAASNATTMSNG